MESWIQAINEYRAHIHLMLHVLVPVCIAWLVMVCAPHWLPNSNSRLTSNLRGKGLLALTIMLFTMVVDVDHLLAVPIYAPNRCSILFHPLHTVWPMVIYTIMLCWPLANKGKYRGLIGWLGAGLIIHMALDAIDCLWMKCAA